MADADKIKKLFESKKGVLRMVPNWLPRPFNRPGKRLKLHPDDYYCLGTKRGAITERWFSSVTPALNGPLAPEDEGLSWVAFSDDYNDKVYFKDCIAVLGAELIGATLQEKYGTWPMFAKYFDNSMPLFHHLHFRNSDAARINKFGKPEAYYFPTQLNNHPGTFPVTYFGYDPDTSKEEVKKRLLMYEEGDNRITELSRAYRLELGTGWYVPPGVVHAPGSLLTYEPQWNSDVNSIQENIVQGEIYPKDFLDGNLPPEEQGDIDAVMALMDWEANIDPHFRKKYFLPPIPLDTGTSDWSEKWITYKNEYVAAKETTIQPGKTAVVRDNAAYGCIIIQGYGEFGAYDDAECAIMLRYNQLSGDEYFVSEKAAKEGVKITNRSKHEPMVILRHFGPNAGAPRG
ncbi:MAG: hypothetical protein LIP23_02780 [Planctomycetes bacterium]|nr:hypothetical protein [Planctomycetota bacterium]